MSALGPTFGQIFDTTYFVKPVNTAMLERIKAEASRQLGVMEAALAKHKYLAGVCKGLLSGTVRGTG